MGGYHPILSLLSKMVLKIPYRKIKRFELENLNKYDYLIAVSERDLVKFKTLGYKNGAMSSPIGLDIRNYNLKINNKVNSDICFIGALDWMPNMEGLMWFLDKVWPEINKHPHVKFTHCRQKYS